MYHLSLHMEKVGFNAYRVELELEFENWAHPQLQGYIGEDGDEREIVWVGGQMLLGSPSAEGIDRAGVLRNFTYVTGVNIMRSIKFYFTWKGSVSNGVTSITSEGFVFRGSEVWLDSFSASINFQFDA